MKFANEDVLKMNQETIVEVDRRFFDALIHADVDELEQILTDDFIIIDVMRGAETSKSEILQAIRSAQVKFEEIEARDRLVRLYDKTGVVTGRTRMTLRFNDSSFEVGSRYTHVYCEQENGWRLVSAQGTRVVES
jgi:ketosteroid isomerase-like protein